MAQIGSQFESGSSYAPYLKWLTEYAIVQVRIAIWSLCKCRAGLTPFLPLQVTPVATKAIGAKYFIIFATTNAIGIPIQYFLYPETGRLTLEGARCSSFNLYAARAALTRETM